MLLVFFYLMYIVILVSSVLISTQEFRILDRDRKIIVNILIVALAFLSGIRPLDVPDTINYVEIFEEHIDLGLFFKDGFALGLRYKSIEYMFIFIAQTFKMIIPSYRVFFAVVSIIISKLTLYGFASCEKFINNDELEFKDESSPILSIWAVYLLIFAMLYNVIAMRAGLAMGIGMFAIGFCLKNKWWHRYVISIGLIILASLIHTTAIIYFAILLIIVLNLRMGKRKFIFLWMFCLFLVMTQFAGRNISEIIKILYYLKNIAGISAFNSYFENIDTSIALRDLFSIVTYGAVVVFGYDNFSDRYKNYALISLTGLIVISILYPIHSVIRFADFFFMFTVPLVANGLKKEKLFTRKKFMYYLLLFLLLMVPGIVVIQSNLDNYGSYL